MPVDIDQRRAKLGSFRVPYQRWYRGYGALLLLCPSFEVPRRDLTGVSALSRPLGHTNLSNEFLIQLLLYGDKDFTDGLNRDILLLALCFIHKTGRFDEEFKSLSFNCQRPLLSKCFLCFC